MGLTDYIKRKLDRRKARRVTREYATRIDTFQLEKLGEVQFANWLNPLVKPYVFNQEMVDFFQQFIPRGSLAIDIGGNIGDTTVPISLAAGAEGLVLAFDPNPIVFKILQENAALNTGKQRIDAFNYAISDQESSYYFVSSEASFGNGGISLTRESRHGRFVYPEKVKGIPLQRFLAEKYPEWQTKLSFIKIDTEGFDKEIIKSIRGLINSYHPVIIAESFGKNSIAEKEELFTLISDLHYAIYLFEDFDINTPVKLIETPAQLAQEKKTVNIYCIPRKDNGATHSSR